MITGIGFILIGWISLKYPPKKINNWYGYRTSSSKKSQERWDFAQHYSSKEMIRMGFLLILISFLGFFMAPSIVEGFAGILIILILTMILLYRVERAIKNKFKK
ncbi:MULTISPECIES: SdpI family protein [Arenibacter]|uniref:SdpI family protein n=1 Tax=Arenibacter TaxID=178469 RepID=UPI000A38CC96